MWPFWLTNEWWRTKGACLGLESSAQLELLRHAWELMTEQGEHWNALARVTHSQTLRRARLLWQVEARGRSPQQALKNQVGSRVIEAPKDHSHPSWQAHRAHHVILNLWDTPGLGVMDANDELMRAREERMKTIMNGSARIISCYHYGGHGKSFYLLNSNATTSDSKDFVKIKDEFVLLGNTLGELRAQEKEIRGILREEERARHTGRVWKHDQVKATAKQQWQRGAMQVRVAPSSKLGQTSGFACRTRSVDDSSIVGTYTLAGAGPGQRTGARPLSSVSRHVYFQMGCCI